MFFVMFVLILRLFDQIKHAKLLSECINHVHCIVFILLRPELWVITTCRLINGTVP